MTSAWRGSLSVENTFLDELKQLLANDWVTRCHLVEVKAASSLQLMKNVLHFGIFKDRLDLRVAVDDLHNRVALHFLFLLLCLLIRNLIEVISRQRTEFHQKLPELRILSILLHGLLRLRAHFLKYLHCSGVLKGSHESRALHNLLHKVRRKPLVLCSFQIVC